MLIARGFSADSIHGGKSQGQRQRVLSKFKDSHITVLVATDVAARGLDISDITHVINYSLPQSYDDYVHRIGRAGRAGRIGFALTFIPR
jgi:ATP-dependent RNA helicase DeaD